MATCDVYWKNKIKLGSGTFTTDSASISSYTSLNVADEARKNVTVSITSGADAGESFRARVITDGGTSLTLSRAAGWAD